MKELFMRSKKIAAGLMVLGAGLGVASAAYVPGEWPAMREYDSAHQLRVALPLGGIGTGTISLGGRGELRDWMEIVDVPQKNVAWQGGQARKQPFFAIHVGGLPKGMVKATALLQGRVDDADFLHFNGDSVPQSGFPRFDKATFAAAYPFGKVTFEDSQLPVRVTLKSFNPLVPCDEQASSLPIAVFSYRVENLSEVAREVSVVGAFHNLIGATGPNGANEYWVGQISNRNEMVIGKTGLRGICYRSACNDPERVGMGTMALATEATNCTYRLRTGYDSWRGSTLSFWRDFSDDGRLHEATGGTSGCENDPLGALSVTKTVPARGSADFTFFLTWSFKKHRSWGTTDNHYYLTFPDAWGAVERIVPQLPSLESRTRRFVETLVSCSYPDAVKEAALFNLSVLRCATTFRLATGELMGWEGVGDRGGSCYGTCKHVWNYEQALPYLFGNLARTQREVEFENSLGADGAMAFRTRLPLQKSPINYSAFPAADGQNGCVQKFYREWRFSGDGEWLKRHWSQVRAALIFAWSRWDLDVDGVMENWQHNTMDVNYIGPNAECNFWYLGALRAGAEMARAMGEDDLSARFESLAEKGGRWMDAHLFNGSFYGHIIYDPKTLKPLAKGVKPPNFQIGNGCMADQFIGQVVAWGAGLGSLAQDTNIRTALGSIMKYNYVSDFGNVFNYNRSYAFAGEAGLVNTAWPEGGEPEYPYPYYAEAWTGIEYGAAAAMAWAGRLEDTARIVRAVRDRYDGRKRNPFSEVECGHHYARSLASWGLIPALSGFDWDARTGEMRFAKRPGRHFWATGRAWGVCDIDGDGKARLTTIEGTANVKKVTVGGARPTRAEVLRSVRRIAEPQPKTSSLPPTAVLFADFDGWDYGDWTAEGDAFGVFPPRGTLANQQKVSGFLGEGLVNTYRNGDNSVGKLTSPTFGIGKRYINFLVGGGDFAGKTCVNLKVDGKVVRTATGHQSEKLEWVHWDVSDLKGRKACIEIVDGQRGPWGHINADNIYFDDEPKGTLCEMGMTRTERKKE